MQKTRMDEKNVAILKYLLKYRRRTNLDGEFESQPYDITAPGIAEKTGIKEAAARRRLKDLVEEDILESEKRWVKGRNYRSRVSVYWMRSDVLPYG